MLKIKLRDNQNLFFTSDTHYNHKNICRGVSAWEGGLDKTRDFPTLDKMNQTIIDGINSKVGPEDYLVHLGDWSFGGFESIRQFRDRILCRDIILILGNHDHHIENNRDDIQREFLYVGKLETLEVSSPMGFKYTFELSHYPMCSWKDMNKGAMHLFGHVHLPKGKHIMRGKSMDVGMDGNNLEPYHILDVVKILRDRPIETSVIQEDHHKTEVR